MKGFPTKYLLSAIAVLVLVGWADTARSQEPGRALPQPSPAVEVTGLTPGMTQVEVRRRLGKPQQTARQILYRRYLEQWVYGPPHHLLIEFTCYRGQPPQIHTVHRLPSPSP